jgi:tetratricopeptide (TPR) repeat protein
MVELDKILSERSDERILKSLKEVSDQEFSKVVEAVLGYLELKPIMSRQKGRFSISECVHRPDGNKYIVFFSRRDEQIAVPDIQSLLSYMKKADAPKGIVFATGFISQEAVKLADQNGIEVADGTKFATLLRRFDLDKEVIKAADLWRERAKRPSIPGADRELEEAMRAGYEALAAKDNMKALDSFDRAIMLREDYDVPWRLKGNTLDEMGYHEQALSCYKRALELYPESDETWFSLGVCLFALGRYNEEIVCYDRALQYNPVMQKALVNKGSTLHRLGKFQEALDTFDKVLRINYRLEKVHNNRGATLHALGRVNDALASYNKAIELKHDYIEAWMNKGSLLFEQTKFGDAFEAFTQMTYLRPELPKGWYLRGLAAKKTGNLSQAKASFEQALRLDPEFVEARTALEDASKTIEEKFSEVPQIVKDILEAGPAAPPPPPPAPEASKLSADAIARVQEETVEELGEELYGDRAEILLLLGRLDEAFDYLGRSFLLEGENPGLLTLAGNVLHGLGKSEAAAKTYEHAIAIDPAYAPALFNLYTMLYETGESERASKVCDLLRRSDLGWQSRAVASIDAFSNGDFKQAIEDIDLAITQDHLAELENLKGMLMIEAGDLEGAADCFNKTKQLPLDPSRAYNNAGVVLFKKGDYEKASLEFDRAIRLQRNNPSAWNNRGCVLYRLDRLRESIACFEESAVMFPTSVALTNKGFTQLSMDLLADAAMTFEQSLKVAETAEAYNNRGIVLERLGKTEDAMVAFKEAIRVSPKFKDAVDNARRIEQKMPASNVSGTPVAPGAAPPGEEVVGSKDSAEQALETYTEDSLREMRRAELEAICESLGLDPEGTRADLVFRILKAKSRKSRK